MTTEIVVTTAAELVDRQGVDALSLAHVADKLGVTHAALYNHVSSASDLLHRLALVARQMLATALRDAAVGRAREDAIFAMAHAWRAFAHEHPGLYAATDRHPLVGFADLEEAVADVVMVLHRVLAGFGLSGADVEHAAWSVRSALHGFVVLEAEGGQPGSTELDESFERLLRLVCDGLAAQAERGAHYGGP